MTTLAFEGICKSYGGRRVVDDLSFMVQPGTVVGFVGPNGAGKTTSLRMLLGVVAPDDGHATIGGVPYAALPHPAATVGAALESQGFYPGRSARQQLRIAARAAGRPGAATDDLLERVGLAAAADRRAGEYSLGMRGRLALACALVGEPAALVLDEPTTGLDRDGVQWLWQLLRAEAARGCAILVSSHALHELETVADAVAILVRGRLVAFGPAAVLGGHGGATRVRCADADRLAAALTGAGIGVRRVGRDELIAETDTARVGSIALERGVAVTGLSDAGADLGALYDELTRT